MRFSENYHDRSVLKKTYPDIAIFPIIMFIFQVHQHGTLKYFRGIQKINAVLVDVHPALALIPLELHGL
jgi:hypothetical protein